MYTQIEHLYVVGLLAIRSGSRIGQALFRKAVLFLRALFKKAVLYLRALFRKTVLVRDMADLGLLP